MKPEDFIGKKINHLRIVSLAGLKNRTILVNCICDCGKSSKHRLCEIISGHVKSCGCLKSRKKGLTNHELYKFYKNMINRCKSKKGNYFTYYGSKGISVCDSWLNDYLSFYNWSINNGYKKGLSLDRISSQKGYSPENCRWTTRTNQAINKPLSSKNKSGARGIFFRKDRNKWISYIDVEKKRFYLGYFDSFKNAFEARGNFLSQNSLNEYMIGEYSNLVLKDDNKTVQDLKKALFYLQDEIKRIENKEEKEVPVLKKTDFNTGDIN